MYFLVDPSIRCLALASPSPCVSTAHHHEPVRPTPCFPKDPSLPGHTHPHLIIHSLIHTHTTNEPESPLIHIAAMYNYSKKKKEPELDFVKEAKNKSSANDCSRSLKENHPNLHPFPFPFFIQTYKHSIVKCPQFPSRSR
jgi:hypothetical protein